MHHGHAEITHDQNSIPELFLRDVIVVINKDHRLRGSASTVLTATAKSMGDGEI